MAHFAIIMLLAGIGIPLLAALNAALGQRLGSPVTAAAILFGVAFLASLIALAVIGRGDLSALPGTPPQLFLGGLFVAFYVLSVTYIAPHFGVGNAVFFVLIGQLISSATIDHFGLFGARVSPLDAQRALGITVMAIGVWITQRA